MSIITDIRDVRGIVEISAEGSVVARIRKSHFFKKPIEIGDDVDLESYFDAIAAIQFSDAYEAALTSLDFCARTAAEIVRILRRKGYVDAVTQAIIERLTENHLLDDRRYAERIAESQTNKAVGLYAVKRKLRAKGISEADVEAALDAFDDEQQQSAAYAAAEKLYRRYCTLPPNEARAKLSQALARRGFSWEIVYSVIDKMLFDESD